MAGNGVRGIPRSPVETGSRAGGTSWIAAEGKGSLAQASDSGTVACGSAKDGNEAGSNSLAGSTESDGNGTGRSTAEERREALEKVGRLSGCEGASERRTGCGLKREGSLVAVLSAID